MLANTWKANAEGLTSAYARHSDSLLGALRQALLTRGLSVNLPAGPQRIIDVGGGAGLQAILLARAGHDVVLLDPDPRMLASARTALASETQQVQSRVSLVRGSGESATSLVGTGFDVVCCHGVLMYLDEPTALLRELVGLARPGGLISVLAKNADAIAMRSGLDGRWTDALTALTNGFEAEDRYVASRADSVDAISDLLAELKACPRTWYGIRIFTDHLGEVPVGSDFDDILELEWAAGLREPYRRVARLFHVIAHRETSTAEGV
jgi:S-adenosylmethionine-dependent methyltransferase